MTFAYKGPCAWEEDPSVNTVCPFDCPPGTAIKKYGVESTLIGWLGSAEKDPNHHTMRCTCEGCGKDFSKEWVIGSKTIWYSKGSYVLMGKPGCCKTYYYLPCECGGRMIHSTKGKTRGEYITPTKLIPMQPMYWVCSQCKKKGPDDRYGWEYLEEGGTRPKEEDLGSGSRKLKSTWSSEAAPDIVSPGLLAFFNETK